MPSPVPNPVAAAVGLVPTVLGGVRRLPGKAVQLPVYAVSHALTSVTTARREYDALAERGQRLLARLRGTSFDEIEDVVEDSLQGTPFARPYDRVEDALEDVGAGVTALVRKGTGRARSAAGSTARSAGSGLDRAADTVEELSGADTAQKPTGKTTKSVASAAQKASAKVEDAAGKADKPAKAASKTASKAAKATAKTADKAEDKVQAAAGKAATATDQAADKVADAAGKGAGKVEQAADKAAQSAAQAAPDDAEAPKGEPTPKATQPDSTRVDTAASDEVVQAVEKVSATVSGEVLPHDELPLPDYDHLTLGSLRGRMRSLDLPQLIQIRDYERAHADRLPIVTMLDNRIAKLANDPTAPLSGGSPLAEDPAKPTPSRGGSKVTPATGGPAQNPPSQGVPTNPAQPRTTGSPGTNPHSDS